MDKNISKRDIARLRATFAHVADDSFFDRYRRMLRGGLPFDTCLFMRFTAQGTVDPASAWLQPKALKKGVLTQYFDGAYRLDPFFQFRDIPPDGGLYRLSQIAPDRFFAGEYFLQYYNQTRLCDEIGLLVPLPDGGRGHLSFSRLQSAGPFRRKELSCLAHFAPLLLELLRAHFMQRNSLPDSRTPQPLPLDDVIRAQVLSRLDVRLTPRESEIAALVLQGHSTTSAALSLSISRETAKVHRRNTYRKLGISSQAQLFALLKDLL